MYADADLVVFPSSDVPLGDGSLGDGVDVLPFRAVPRRLQGGGGVGERKIILKAWG